MASQTKMHFRRRRKLSVLVNYEKRALASFKWDCERFLEQFEKQNSFDYSVFANIWQLNNFSLIYVDQHLVDPLRVLCEACFITVKKYIMFQKSLHIRVGAFYLLYGLYYKQPIEGLVRIRLTLSEYRQAKALMDEMISKGHPEMAYVFVKMKLDNAFLFVAHPQPLNMELNKSLKNTTLLDDTFQARGSESALSKFQDILVDETVKNLEETSKNYDALLKRYAEKCPSLATFTSKIMDNLKEAHSYVFDPINNEENSTKSSKDNNVTKNTRQAVRLRALTNKNSQYRGSKKVITALDLDESSSDESD